MDFLCYCSHYISALFQKESSYSFLICSLRGYSFCGDCSYSALCSLIGAWVTLEMFVGHGSTRVLPTIFFPALCHGCRMDYSIWSVWLCKMLYSYALSLELKSYKCLTLFFIPDWKVSSTDDLMITATCLTPFVRIAFIKTISPTYEKWLHSHPKY